MPCVLIGCGCLVVLAVLGGIGFIGFRMYQEQLGESELGQNWRELLEQIEGVDLEEAPSEDMPENDGTGDGEGINDEAYNPADFAEPAVQAAQPTKERAFEIALRNNPGWLARTDFASPDMQRLKVLVGPREGQWVMATVLQWDPAISDFNVERSDPVEPPKPAATRTASTQQASGAQPSRNRAVAAALSQAPERGWVARVSSNSSDWRTAKILIGPPHSEFAGEISVRWDAGSGQYRITGIRPIDPL